MKTTDAITATATRAVNAENMSQIIVDTLLLSWPNNGTYRFCHDKAGWLRISGMAFAAYSHRCQQHHPVALVESRSRMRCGGEKARAPGFLGSVREGDNTRCFNYLLSRLTTLLTA